MNHHATEGSASGVYLALKIASWVALASILVAIGWATYLAVVNWNVIHV